MTVNNLCVWFSMLSVSKLLCSDPQKIIIIHNGNFLTLK